MSDPKQVCGNCRYRWQADGCCHRGPPGLVGFPLGPQQGAIVSAPGSVPVSQMAWLLKSAWPPVATNQAACGEFYLRAELVNG